MAGKTESVSNGNHGNSDAQPVLLGRHGPNGEKTSASKRFQQQMRQSLEDLEQGGDVRFSEFAHSDSALTFQEVSFSVKGPAGELKAILEPVSGHFSSGKLVAIMGPSGCGKTTLLDILAGKKTGPHEGTVHFNGRPRNALFRRLTAYVPQEDHMAAHMTVKEAVLFVGELKERRPSKFTYEMACQRTERWLQVLGLDGVKDSLIGDGTYIRGISGGQRRRLSLARGLAAGAHIMFCDEPTSGLSSTDAEGCVKYMQHVAHKYNVLIIVVIHQPRIEVSEKFDHLLLLTSEPGRCVYNGPMEGVRAQCASAGYPVLENTNPTDFFMDKVTPGTKSEKVDLFLDVYECSCKPEVDELVVAELSHLRQTPHQLLDAHRKTMLAYGDLPPVDDRIYGVGFCRQLQLVLVRQLIWRLRDRQGIATDLLAALVKALVIGTVYCRTGELAAPQQVAFYFMVCMSCSIDGLKNMPSLVSERTIVKVETSEALYSEWAYVIAFSAISCLQGLLAQTIFISILYSMTGLEWSLFPAVYCWSTLLFFAMDQLYVMVASIAKDATSAAVLSTPFLMVFLLFNGFTASRGTVSSWASWAIDVSPVAQCLEQITIAAYNVYLHDPDLAAGYEWVIGTSKFRDEPYRALSVVVTCVAIFKVVQVACFRALNNIQR